MIAAVDAGTALAFIEIGLLALGLAVLARVASRLGITAVPFYLVAGLGFGDGGVADIGVSEEFVSLGAEIGVLLLLFTLGLEYSGSELTAGLRTSARSGVVDAAANFTPGLLMGLILGWSTPVAVLLGGVTWVSSSGVVSKVLADLDRLGYRETPAILNILVVEDLAMAVYLPVVAAVVAGGSLTETGVTIVIALFAVAVILWAATSWGAKVSSGLERANNESLLLSVFGLTLLVAGLAQRLEISAAIGAFLVGLAVSGPVLHRVRELMEPLRDLFAAIFFIFFAFGIDPEKLPAAFVPALALMLVSGLGKLVTGWVAAGRIGASSQGRLRAGTTLVPRGEFSIVIASLGVGLAEGSELTSLATAYVLLTAIVGPLLAKHSDELHRRVSRYRADRSPGTVEAIQPRVAGPDSRG